MKRDGSEPDEDSTEYTSPLNVFESVIIKAKAIKPDAGESKTVTAGYKISSEGDINTDQRVDLKDAILALQVTAGFSVSDADKEKDISGDGKIGLAEAIFILRELAELGGFAD